MPCWAGYRQSLAHRGQGKTGSPLPESNACGFAAREGNIAFVFGGLVPPLE
jgi:hypothetical protein